MVVTLDFWNTMVVAKTGGEARRRARTDHLLALVQRYRRDATEDLVADARRSAHARFDAVWKAEHRTLGADDLLRFLWDELALPVSDAEHAETVRVYEEGLLIGPPDLTPGLVDFVQDMAGRVRLGIISDTMFSPGRVIRRLLDRHGLLEAFGMFAFSDETGCAKPDPRAFATILDETEAAPSQASHVGDLRRTDVAGAIEAGWTAIQYTGVHVDDAANGPAPHAVAPDWDAVAAALDVP
ncbi:MAG: HAD family hydrolase [Bacteroidota bacterium]